MVKREEYLNKLFSWKDEQVIKVVSGIRRCGKSTLLKQYIDMLAAQSVDRKQIIYLNLEEPENDELYDYKKLYEYITKRLCKDRYTYIFLDEIQKVDGFEKAVDSLYVKDKVDIYISLARMHICFWESLLRCCREDMLRYLCCRFPLIVLLLIGFGACMIG